MSIDSSRRRNSRNSPGGTFSNDGIALIEWADRVADDCRRIALENRQEPTGLTERRATSSDMDHAVYHSFKLSYQPAAQTKTNEDMPLFCAVGWRN